MYKAFQHGAECEQALHKRKLLLNLEISLEKSQHL